MPNPLINASNLAQAVRWELMRAHWFEQRHQHTDAAACRANSDRYCRNVSEVVDGTQLPLVEGAPEPSDAVKRGFY